MILNVLRVNGCMAVNRLVMVVDDEADILTTAKQILDVFGYPSLLVREAAQVLETAGKAQPMVILQDVVMPGLHVEKLVRQLKKGALTKNIPVILFSASLTIREICRQAKADGYVLKPFDLSELRAMLEKYAGKPS